MYIEQHQQHEPYSEPEYEPQQLSRGKIVGAWVFRHPILALAALLAGSTALILLSPYLIVAAPIVIVTVVIYRAMKVPANRERVGAAVARGKTRISDAIELRRSRRSE